MKKSLLILLAAWLFTACGAIKSQMTAARNMAKVELNMAKREVVRVMGDRYETVGARSTPNGTEEVIGYLDANNDIYLLTFRNGRLVEYHKEWLPDRNHGHRERNGRSGLPE